MGFEESPVAGATREALHSGRMANRRPETATRICAGIGYRFTANTTGSNLGGNNAPAATIQPIVSIRMDPLTTSTTMRVTDSAIR